MKRTFQFGLLAVLAVIPYPIFLILTLLFINIPIYTNFILLKKDAELYDILAKVPYNHFIDYSIIIGILWLVFIVWLTWRWGFINKDRLKFWRVIKEYPKTHPGGKLGMAGRVALSIALVAGGLWFSSRGYDAVVKPQSGFYIVSYHGPYAIIRFFSCLFSPNLPLVFFASTLIYAITTSKTAVEFRKKSVVPLAGLMLIGGMLLSLAYLQSYLDLDKDISKIPGLTAKPERRHLVALLNPAVSTQLNDYFNDPYTFPSGKHEIPYSKENEKAVYDYMKGGNYVTCLRTSIYEYLIISRQRELDNIGVLHLYKEAFFNTGDSIYPLMALSKINVGTAGNEQYRLLTELIDETRISAKGKGALIISRVYAKFGEMDKANYWYDMGVKTGYVIDEKDKATYKPPTEVPFNKGRVSGNITLNGLPCGGLRVGIIREGSIKSVLSYAKDKEGGLVPVHYLNLSDGTATDNSGNFTFARLPEDKYVILLSIKDVAGKKIKVLNSPGTIAVSKDKPSAAVGTIRLVSE